MKIGIPRALLYYWYGHLWQRFWQKCGVDPIVSKATDRQIIKAGTEVAVDELCLPVKIFLGHIGSLASQADWVMLPHLVKVERDAFICPKFMGLPDLAVHTLPWLKPKLLVVKVGPKQPDMIRSLVKAASQIGISPPSKINLREMMDPAHESPAVTIIKSYQPPQSVHHGPQLTVGLLGHPYCLYDSCFNLNLLQILTSNGIRFLTPELTPPAFHGLGSGRLHKKLFWTLGRSQFDGLEWMLQQEQLKVSGFIHLTSFACGLEAIIGDMLERRVKAAGQPFLRLNFEEHSGEAGLITRVEAFISMLQYRQQAS
jgi:predicted nucleotide-binding protein (sugar kinase/HSP70/actin superfamily)